jgi:predicted house-cleaning noncanonical NTP pyrophosphatase (MazG superfamily)
MPKKQGRSSFRNIQSNDRDVMMDVLNRPNYLNKTERQLLENIFEDEELREIADKVAVMNQSI